MDEHLREMKPDLRKILPALICAVCILIMLPPGTHAAERFLYDLKWFGVKAGEATIDFVEDTGRVEIRSTARSIDWLSNIYKVDDTAESTVLRRSSDPEHSPEWVSARYRLKISEGRHRKEKEVIFDQERGKAIYMDHLEKERKLFAIPEATFDPLSAFFLLRKAAIDVRKPVYTRVFDSKKVWDVRIDVLRREEVKTGAGSFRTVVVKPNMESEGIFRSMGDIFIYLTDDSRHIPVLMKIKIVIGYVMVELVGGEY